MDKMKQRHFKKRRTRFLKLNLIVGVVKGWKFYLHRFGGNTTSRKENPSRQKTWFNNNINNVHQYRNRENLDSDYYRGPEEHWKTSIRTNITLLFILEGYLQD